MQWHTYILNCADGSFYVGHTNNVETGSLVIKPKQARRTLPPISHLTSPILSRLTVNLTPSAESARSRSGVAQRR